MFKRWWPVFLLLCVEIGLAFVNIKAGTWLIGWDSTQPELAFGVHITRNLSSVWQEYRGLGMTDAMAHGANLVHVIYVWILSLVMSVNYVRYAYVLICHLMGGVGMYVLTRYLLKKNEGLSGQIMALAGALLYMLNPYTVQMFYQPLELFVTHFAALPWSVWILMSYLEKPTKRNLTWLFLINVLAIPQAHVPTIFIVYAMTQLVIILAYVVTHWRTGWKRILVVASILFGVNAFWGLPFIYSAVTSSAGINASKSSMLSNSEVVLRNVEYGDTRSVVAMEGFSLSYEDWLGGGSRFGMQMPQWVEWWGQGWVVYVGWSVVAVAMIGLVVSAWRRKWKIAAVGIVWLFALCNLGLRIPIVSSVGWALREYVPYYDAIFRFAFTKFAFVYAMTLTGMFVYGLNVVVTFVKWKAFQLIILLVVIGGIVGWSLPVFRGEMIYDKLRIELPSEYQKLFTFMASVEKGRVLPLSQFDFWGWETNEWGYRGSGFVWQGIDMPILHKAFYAWNEENEGFYGEFSNALYSCNPTVGPGLPTSSSQLGFQPGFLSRPGPGEQVCESQIENVLQKYDVRYVLLDESVIAPGQDTQILRIPETKALMNELGAELVWQENFLSVWDLGKSQIINSQILKSESQFISAPGSYTWVDGDMNKVRKDVIYGDVGTYVFSTHERPLITYPFAGVMREEVKNISYTNTGITLGSDSVGLQGRELVVPGWKVGEIVRIEFKEGEPLPAYYVSGQAGPIFLGKERPEEGKNIVYARISEGKEWREYLIERKFDLPNGEAGLQGDSLKVEVPSEPQIYDFGKEGQGTIGNCDVLKRGIAGKQGTSYIADERGAVCDYIVMPQLDTRLSYLMRIQGQNIEGRSLKFFLYNTGSKRNDIEWLMRKDKFDQTFGLLPWSWDGYYTLNIETRSFGQRAENIINPVEVRWFPLEQIAGAKVVPIRSDLPADESAGWDQPLRSDLVITKVKKIGTWLYRVKVEGSGLLKLSQGYDEGWIGIGLRHVKVDGWANGWMVGQSGEVTIFYWPQLLEYFGFVVLLITLIVVLFEKR